MFDKILEELYEPVSEIKRQIDDLETKRSEEENKVISDFRKLVVNGLLSETKWMARSVTGLEDVSYLKFDDAVKYFFNVPDMEMEDVVISFQGWKTITISGSLKNILKFAKKYGLIIRNMDEEKGQYRFWREEYVYVEKGPNETETDHCP